MIVDRVNDLIAVALKLFFSNGNICFLVQYESPSFERADVDTRKSVKGKSLTDKYTCIYAK